MNGSTRFRAAFLTIVLLAVAVGAGAQTSTGFTISFRGGVPDPQNVFVDRGVVGGMVGYRTANALLFAFDYLYIGKDYYYFENGSWSDGVGWSDVPSGESSRSDWIFYRSRQLISPSVGLSGPVGPVGLYATVGVNLTFVVLSDARSAYPGFSKAADTSPTKLMPVARGGVRWPARSLFGFQIEYSWSREDALLMFGACFDSGGSS